MHPELEQHIRNRDYTAALAVSRALYDRARTDGEIAAMHGHVLQQLRMHTEARQVLEQAGTLLPKLPSIWIDLAGACIAGADWIAAKDAVSRFRVLAPASGAGMFAEAEIQLGLGNGDRAEALFRQAAATHTAYFERRLQLAGRACDARDYALAGWHYQGCITQRADALPAHIDYLACLFQQRQYVTAVALARDAAKRFPDDARLLHRYSVLLDLIDCDPAERLQVRTRWLKNAPNSVDAHLALANALASSYDFVGAHRHWQRARELDPTQVIARWTALHFPAHVLFQADPVGDAGGDCDHQAHAFAQRWMDELAYFDSMPTPETDICLRLILSCASHHLMYAQQDVERPLRKRGVVLSRFCDQALGIVDSAPTAQIVRARRRIGIVSSSFGWHSVSRVWRELMLAVDRRTLELICYNIDAGDDHSVAQWRARADVFVERQGDLGDWHRCLSAADLDVLIFLDLGPHTVAQALATRRYAPVQCTTWAHPVTSGLSTIDYFLSSDLMEPADGQMHYCEQLIRLPGLACAYQADAGPGSKTSPESMAHDGAGVRYLCAQTSLKLLPEHDALFTRILANMPGSVLSLSHGGQELASAAIRSRIGPVLNAGGIDAESRIRVLAHIPYADYLKLLEQTDVLLDTLHFSGCLTSLDALSMDIPIVTLPGTTMRGRQTAAMLRVLDLPELIAQDEDDYVRIATELGRDHLWRNAIRQHIRERKHRLLESAESVRGLERFLREVQPLRQKD